MEKIHNSINHPQLITKKEYENYITSTNEIVSDDSIQKNKNYIYIFKKIKKSNFFRKKIEEIVNKKESARITISFSFSPYSKRNSSNKESLNYNELSSSKISRQSKLKIDMPSITTIKWNKENDPLKFFSDTNCSIKTKSKAFKSKMKNELITIRDRNSQSSYNSNYNNIVNNDSNWSINSKKNNNIKDDYFSSKTKNGISKNYFNYKKNLKTTINSRNLKSKFKEKKMSSNGTNVYLNTPKLNIQSSVNLNIQKNNPDNFFIGKTIAIAAKNEDLKDSSYLGNLIDNDFNNLISNKCMNRYSTNHNRNFVVDLNGTDKIKNYDKTNFQEYKKNLQSIFIFQLVLTILFSLFCQLYFGKKTIKIRGFDVQKSISIFSLVHLLLYLIGIYVIIEENSFYLIKFNSMLNIAIITEAFFLIISLFIETISQYAISFYFYLMVINVYSKIKTDYLVKILGQDELKLTLI